MDVADLVTFTCEGSRDGQGCGATYTGLPHELPQLGWGRHPFTSRVAPKRGELLLCNDCEQHYRAIWTCNERKKAA